MILANIVDVTIVADFVVADDDDQESQLNEGADDAHDVVVDVDFAELKRVE
mgnify:CR=1 FL=1